MAGKKNALAMWVEGAKVLYKGKPPKVHRDQDCVTPFNVGYVTKGDTDYVAGCADKDTADFILKALLAAYFAPTEAIDHGGVQAAATKGAGPGFKNTPGDEE